MVDLDLPKAEVNLVAVSVAQSRPGRILNKTLFQQIIVEWPQEIDKIEILGWVNYFPNSKGSWSVGGFRYKPYGLWEDNWLHVLWKNSLGELRRFLICKTLFEEQSNGEAKILDDEIHKLYNSVLQKGQVFLGAFFKN